MPLADLRRHIGDRSQVVSIRDVRLGDGNEDGVRALDVRVTGGPSALVLLDRGMDLGPVWVAGHQVRWQSPTGMAHPVYERRLRLRPGEEFASIGIASPRFEPTGGIGLVVRWRPDQMPRL